jgi:uncharacterized protein
VRAEFRCSCPETIPTIRKPKALHAFIRDAGFPCVGAKSALSKGGMRVLVARDITSAWDDMRIYPA